MRRGAYTTHLPGAIGYRATRVYTPITKVRSCAPTDKRLDYRESSRRDGDSRRPGWPVRPITRNRSAQEQYLRSEAKRVPSIGISLCWRNIDPLATSIYPWIRRFYSYARLRSFGAAERRVQGPLTNVPLCRIHREKRNRRKKKLLGRETEKAEV